MRTAIAIVLFAGTVPGAVHDPLHPVSFVGCPADGQVGPIPAPKNGRSLALPPRNATKLAYYADGNGFGVLGPRGWHCVELYGSSGRLLIVTPERHAADEFFGEKPADIRGPAVQISVSTGGTSGRNEVAEGIARYFPSHRAFLQQVINQDREVGYSVEPLSNGPDASDIIRRRSQSLVQFTTPAGKKGEGTRSRLLPGNLPIDGFVAIVGPAGEPDLISVQARLPANLRSLAPIILSNAEANAIK